MQLSGSGIMQLSAASVSAVLCSGLLPANCALRQVGWGNRPTAAGIETCVDASRSSGGDCGCGSLTASALYSS